ncbi:MAG: hypothetical protein R2729_16305 [Bryobacteraceae bacterium]
MKKLQAMMFALAMAVGSANIVLADDHKSDHKEDKKDHKDDHKKDHKDDHHK